jgi:6-phosphogluconolactonase
MSDDIRIQPTLMALSTSAADIVIQTAHTAISKHGRFSISLSGGSTPRSLFALLAQPKYRDQIDWRLVDIFWGDERCVPPNHPDSDYGMARAALLDRLPDTAQPVIHRMEGELDPHEAAQRYEAILREYFGPETSTSFDLLLLGLGEDGHTASLFPHTQPIHETTLWVAGHYVPKLTAYRLTLTPPILNRSKTVLFLVAGKSKASVLSKVIYGDRNPDEFPSQIIKPESGNLIWLIDQEAASELTT